MLRIERLNEDDATVTLKLDGRIVGQWVAILKKECFQVLKRHADVTFIGREGVEILEASRWSVLTVLRLSKDCSALMRCA